MTSRFFTRGLAAAGFAFSLGLSAAPVANAVGLPMPSAQAYGMDWIPYIDPSDLPPVAQRKVVCLVDSGVDITPDLPADRFEGPIVRRISIDETSGLAGPAWENQHGTRMATLAGAMPGNEYGGTGLWPAVRVLSVRAMAYDARAFAGRDYEKGVRACNVATSAYPLAAINLSLGCRCQLDPEERLRLEDAISRVHAPEKSVNVVVAAGNEGGGLTAPSNAEGAFPIAAGDGGGELCDYASYDSRAVLGPGCKVPEAMPADPSGSGSGGSSGATMHASVLLAVLRTLKPHAGYEESEGWVRAGARNVGSRAVLSGEGSARVAGLGGVVDRARARLSAVSAQTPAVSSAPTVPAGQIHPAGPPGSTPDRLPRQTESQGRGNSLKAPVAAAEWRRGRLHVRLHSRPSSAKRLIVRAWWTNKGRTRTARRAVSTCAALSVPFSTRPLRISLAYAGQPVGGRTPRSTATVLHRTTGRDYR